MADIWEQKLQEYIKKQIAKMWKKLFSLLLGGGVPFLLILFSVLFIGSGVFAAFSAIGGLIDGLYGSADSEQIAVHRSDMDGLNLEELMDIVKSGQIAPSFYDMMMINEEEFLYLLTEVWEYNHAYAIQDIEIETKHVYTVTEQIADGAGGYTEQEVTYTEYPYRRITVDSREVETFTLDWQLVYALCLSDVMNGADGWSLRSEDDGMKTMVHYEVTHSKIDDILDAVRMNYEYIYDLARSGKTTYTTEECQALVHTPYQYGDPDTEEGEWTYYVPHSLLSMASSAYSAVYYLINDTEDMLTDQITGADMDRFDLTASRFSYHYNLGYISVLLRFLPGGDVIADQLAVYDEHRETAVIIEDRPFGESYVIGNGIDLSQIPVSMGIVTDIFDAFDYGDAEFDESQGGAIVRAARRKVGCGYSQANRWAENTYDCSSFVWRILAECGIDLHPICGGSTAAAICKGMVEAGMTLPPADIQPGDIIFYSYEVNGRYRNVSHVAIYAGNGKKIHAKGVRYGVVEDHYSTQSLVCVCRPYL